MENIIKTLTLLVLIYATASCSTAGNKEKDSAEEEAKTEAVAKDSVDNKGLSEKYVFLDAVQCIHIRRTCQNLRHVYRGFSEVKAVNPNGGYQIIYIERNKVPEIKDDYFFCVDCISEKDYEKLVGGTAKSHFSIHDNNSSHTNFPHFN